jgi:DNA polymerase (family 10)
MSLRAMHSLASSMTVDPHTIAALLREIAAYLWLEGESFRARAYQRAATVVESVPELERVIAEQRLTSLPRIGTGLAATITALAETGTTPQLDELRARWPAEKLARSQKRRRGAAAGARPTLLLPQARELTESLLAHLGKCAASAQAEAAGDVRRWQETPRQLDVAVAIAPGASVTSLREHMAQHPLVLAVDAESDARTRLRLATGTEVSLHTTAPERWGVTLARATGAEAHWLKLSARAAARGLDLASLDLADERALYAALDLPYLPPEVRDGDDELDAADLGAIDDHLIEYNDVRGAVHCHTTYSDGKNSVEEMAQAALELGFDYITITDHSGAAHYAGGLTLDRLRAQWDEIDAVQQRVGIRILKGTEADILADGALDWPDAVLEQLDVVIASVHQRHKLDEDEMTRRLVRAMRAPIFKIWGHALGRLLGSREPFACRIEEVLDAIAAAPAAIEINGDPHRLDLEPRWARRASDRGIRFVLSSDAHSVGALKAVEYAVGMARRARLRADEVLNTMTADGFMRAVKPKRGRAGTDGR